MAFKSIYFLSAMFPSFAINCFYFYSFSFKEGNALSRLENIIVLGTLSMMLALSFISIVIMFIYLRSAFTETLNIEYTDNKNFYILKNNTNKVTENGVIIILLTIIPLFNPNFMFLSTFSMLMFIVLIIMGIYINSGVEYLGTFPNVIFISMGYKTFMATREDYSNEYVGYVIGKIEYSIQDKFVVTRYNTLNVLKAKIAILKQEE